MNRLLLQMILIPLFLLMSYFIVSGNSSDNGDIMFDHQLHIDIECSDCHGMASESILSTDKLLPEMDFCGDCHDIEDADNCSTCHRNGDDPGGILNPSRTMSFSHKKHFELNIDCSNCHTFSSDDPIPGKPKCMSCHDNQTAKSDCSICHGTKQTLLDIHPLNWRDQHGSRAVTDDKFCYSCHKNETFCINCHRGDNTNGNIHDLNYRYTHGLDAGGRETNCGSCHDNQSFCNDCHLRENRMPLEHSTLGWINEHGNSARNNIENCASCHDSSDPNCARIGCHSDNDGLRGTNPPIHSGINGGEHASWHNDDGSICFQCHTNTRTAGTGFCGYCHGFQD